MYVCRASRKDFRNTVGIARAAQPGWAGRTALNRGQILYRLAEMLEDRAASMNTASADVLAAADRAVHHAGWSDKITAILSSVNPVASGHVNYSMLRGMGIVVALPDPEDGLLGIVEAVCASLVMSNSVILLVPTARAELATTLSEALATSDFPAGVINILTGDVPSVLDWADRHDDVDAVYVAGHALTADRLSETCQAAARVIRRVIKVSSGQSPATPTTLQRLAEVKTVWMSS
jgi:acyl-CoA reductase-like NAD-dependent aldehyde dehydrogenase